MLAAIGSALLLPAASQAVTYPAACSDSRTGLYHDASITITGDAPPGPVETGDVIQVQNLQAEILFGEEKIVALYQSLGGVLLFPGPNLVSMSFTVFVQGTGTDPALLALSPEGASFGVTIDDPNGFPDGDETAVVEPASLSLENGSFDAGIEHAAFSIQRIEWTTLSVDGSCRAGEPGPGGTTLVPSTPPAFASTLVVVPVSVPFTCTAPLVGGPYAATSEMGALMTPDPPVGGQTFDLSYTVFRMALPDAFLQDLIPAAQIGVGVYPLDDFEVDQGVVGESTLPASRGLIEYPSMSLTVTNPGGGSVASADPVDLFFVDTQWLPAGGSVAIRQDELLIRFSLVGSWWIPHSSDLILRRRAT